MTELMSLQEIHEFGIEIVCGQMKNDGFEFLGVNPSLEIIPQIIAKKDGTLAHVAVRTACYPNKGQLESEEMALALIRNANESGAKCYFASVGIVNADGHDDEGLAIAKRGAGFLVAYEGLQLLTTSDRIRIIGSNE
jgi:hypothetical protein